MQINFIILAAAIFTHENSLHYPYGIEHNVKGRLTGYPPIVAREKCIALCQKEFKDWNGQGDYFQFLNHVYAKDPRWFLDVEKLYNQKMKEKKL